MGQVIGLNLVAKTELIVNEINVPCWDMKVYINLTQPFRHLYAEVWWYDGLGYLFDSLHGPHHLNVPPQ